MRKLLFITFWFCGCAVWAQPLPFTFHRLSTEDGLSMGNVTAFAQDKHGYVWLGTSNGLNRYDGYGFKVLEHLYGDSTSLLPSQIRNLFSDSEGRLWVSFMHGLQEYNFEKNTFRTYAKGRIFWVGDIVEAKPGLLYIGTYDGLARMNSATGEIKMMTEAPWNDTLLRFRVVKMQRLGDELYILSPRQGLLVFNLTTERTRRLQLPSEIPMEKINGFSLDTDGNCWVSTVDAEGVLYQFHVSSGKNCKTFNDLAFTPGGAPSAIAGLFHDKQNRLWITTSLNGLALFDTVHERFRTVRHRPNIRNSPPGNHLGRMFQDKQGYLWIGTAGLGAAYFHPDNRLFTSLMPENTQQPDGEELWASDAVELSDGTLWLATSVGLIHYNPVSGASEVFQNKQGKPKVLYSNSVRSLCLDRNGNLWIGTSEGVNRLQSGSKTIEFLDEKHGIPKSFNLAITEDHTGTIWFGTQAVGHYYWLPGADKAVSILEHPVLKNYAYRFGHVIFEDSKHRMWFGLDGRGLIFYDPAKQEAKWFERTAEVDTTLGGNYIFSIAEDKKGTIWVSTANGLSAIDPNTFHFTNYDKARGFPANRTTSMTTDRFDRVWVGTPRGLLLLDSTHKHYRLFDTNDGLAFNEFSVMPPTELRDGRLLFPSRGGFVVFHPDDFTTPPAPQTPLLSGIRVFNKPFPTNGEYETLEELYLPPDQNYLSLEMTALNYQNPQQTWYAYRLDPYDKDWTYTQDRAASYTNLPTGHFVFRYKASTDPNRWEGAEKNLRLYVDEHWYKATWFWLLVTLTALGGAGWLLNRRFQYRRLVLQLERKAQALAKDKAIVQYENLTQQLNPHFLFNSLASLGSLIRFDQKQAVGFLESLSKMYRYILQSSEHETVSLGEELSFVQHFIQLQKTRFGEALQIDIDVDKSLYDKRIVPVTLQNLLENALKHNTLDIDDPLIIKIYTSGNCLNVRNNIQRRPVVENSNNQGLERLRTLYQYLSDEPLRVEEKDGEFVVCVPLV
ncbi:MAG: histidine kinase [Saprospiraceae bacterium]|nr:histidine kinase [Saprospiraceae bacterium]